MRGSAHDEEANAASWEAVHGALYGAAKYGALMGVVHGVGHFLSPVYRGLTIQFKV